MPLRRVAPATFAALAVLVAFLATPATPAAANAPTLTITSPTADAQLAGQVTITATYTADTDAEIYSADFRIDGARAHVDISAGTCQTTCEVSATIDTIPNRDAWRDTGLQERTVDDGPAWLEVTVHGRLAGAIATMQVNVDNDRPTITAPEEPVYDGDYTDIMGTSADDTLRIVLDPRVPPESTATIDHIDVQVPGYDFKFPPVTITRPEPGQPWAYVVDTSAINSGSWTAHAIAYDTRGVPSGTLETGFVVDHGPIVTFGAMADPLPAAWTGTIRMTATPPQYLPTTWITRYEVLVDNVLHYASEPWVFHPVTGFGARVWDTPLPEGRHTLTVRVHDNRGASTDATREVMVDGGPAITWTAGAGTTVAPKSRTRLAASLAAIPNTQVASWSLDVDGATVATSGDCMSWCPSPMAATASWTAPATPGTHLITVRATSSSLATRTATSSIRVHPAGAISIVAPTKARYGTGFALRGTARGNDGKPLAGASVAAQYRKPGTTTWRTHRTVTATSTGAVTAPIAATMTNATWRLLLAAKSGAWTTAASGSRTVPVTARVAAYRPATTARKGRATTFQIRSAPYERGLRLAVQIRKAGGTWRTVSRPAVGVTGRSYAGVAFPTAGTWYLRAFRPPTTKISRGRSPVWTVRVG